MTPSFLEHSLQTPGLDEDQHSDISSPDLTPEQTDPDLAGLVQNVQNVVTSVGTGVAALTNAVTVTPVPVLNGIKRFPPRPVNLGVKANLLNRFNKINKNVQQIASAFDAVSRSDLDWLDVDDLAAADLEEEEAIKTNNQFRSTPLFWGSIVQH